MDFFVINPQFDTPANFIIAAFLFGLAVWSAIYISRQNRKFNEDNK